MRDPRGEGYSCSMRYRERKPTGKEHAHLNEDTHLGPRAPAPTGAPVSLPRPRTQARLSSTCTRAYTFAWVTCILSRIPIHVYSGNCSPYRGDRSRCLAAAPSSSREEPRLCPSLPNWVTEPRSCLTGEPKIFWHLEKVECKLRSGLFQHLPSRGEIFEGCSG